MALYTRPTSGAITTRYLLHDHQGSVAEITDSAGGAYVGESFGAFGERRDAADWNGPIGVADEAAIAGATQRGYTLHGHLEGSGLIHMNGRVADSVAGRFLSADPYVPYPGLSQSFNRYAYVHNNPLTFTDPSGFTLGPSPFWRLDSGGFEFGGLDIDGGISLSFIWGGRSHSGQSRPAPVKGCFVPGSSGCYGKAASSGLFDMIFDGLSGPLPGYGAYEDLVLYYNDPDGYGRFDNEIILVQDVGAAVLYEFVLLPIEEALQGRILSALCKVAKLCRVAERFGGRLLELVIEKGKRLFRRKIEGVSSNSSQRLGDLDAFSSQRGGPRNKPGSHGQFKGTDALRRENRMAHDAATRAGLNREQRRILHDEISGQGIDDFQELLRIAEDVKAGRY